MDRHKREETGKSVAQEIVQTPDVEMHTLNDTGVFPNNSMLPLLIYKQALNPDVPDLIEHVRRLFEEHQWDGSWIDSMYDFHHYHSTAHEVLAICGGQAEVRFGGDYGITRTISAGDVIIIPAGIAHKKIGARDDFVVVGAYPVGQVYDMCYGNEDERPKADENIAAVPLPRSDPVYGPLMHYWAV
ncbi:MAG: hypothetical protein A2Y77_13405 [Planctomycetes bacterium RBG_13_62_9]|nr:MAG: hypothetical protein A2Y77_13405 [Planctomycetes bacterium RBG_13_62_9]